MSESEDTLTVIVDADTPIQRIGFLDLASYDDYIKACDVNIRHIVGTSAEYGRRAFSLPPDSDFKVCLYFTDNQRPRYRNKFDIHEEYKEKRKHAKREPAYLKDMVDYIKSKFEHEWLVVECNAKEQEADDAVVSKAYQLLNHGYPYIIVGVDKDLKQAPGLHYNFVKEEGTFINKHDADMFIYYQLLEGDAADSIGGIDGIGPVKAKKLLEKCSTPLEAYTIVLEIYQETYGLPLGGELFQERAQKLFMSRNGMNYYEWWETTSREWL